MSGERRGCSVTEEMAARWIGWHLFGRAAKPVHRHSLQHKRDDQPCPMHPDGISLVALRGRRTGTGTHRGTKELINPVSSTWISSLWSRCGASAPRRKAFWVNFARQARNITCITRDQRDGMSAD